MKTIFTTFYCDRDGSTYYRDSAMKLKQRIEELGGVIITHTPIIDGGYQEVCLYKPTIILKTLREHKRDIIWIDADCVVNELPVEMDNISHDMAAVTRVHDMRTPHSALILFRYNEKVLSFVQTWEQKCIDKLQEAQDGIYKGGDHHLLIEALRERKDIHCVMLPMSVACSVNPNVKVFINISSGGLEV